MEPSKSPILTPMQKLLGEDFNPSLLIEVLRRSWLWLILIPFVTLSVSFLFLRYKTPTYQSVATIMVKPQYTSRALEMQNILDEKEIYGEIEVIRSKEVISGAVEHLDLQVSYFQENQVLDNEMYKRSPFRVEILKIKSSNAYGNRIDVSLSKDNTYTLSYRGKIYNSSFLKKLETDDFTILLKASFPRYNGSTDQIFEKNFYFFLNHQESVIKNLKSSIEVFSSNPRANTIDISLKGTLPRKLSDIINAISDQYIKYDLKKRSESASLILAFIDQQIEKVGSELNLIENQIKEFKKANKIINTSSEQSNILTHFSSIEKEQVDLTLEKSALKWFYDYVKSGKDLSSFKPAGINASFSIFNEYIKQMNLLHEKREELLLSVNDNDPRVELIENQVDDIRKLLLESVQNAINTNILQQSMAQKKYENYENTFNKLPEKEAQLIRLKRLSSIKEKFYLLLLDKKSEFAISKEGIVSNKVILQKAEANYNPIFPNRIMIKGVGLISGVMISLVILLFKFLSYNHISSIHEIEKYTNASILGSIIAYKTSKEVSTLLVNNNPKSQIAESFRSIRSNLQFIANDEGPKVIATTSTVSGEGKTFISINLAGIISLMNKKVIVLDFDMRNPKIHKSFDLPNEKGVSTLIIKQNSLDEVIQSTQYQHLDVITSGPIPPNPSELINSKERNVILDELKKKYDYIILDTPPVGIVIDALDLLKDVDYPIYVLRANYSKKDFINNINKIKIDGKINNLSLVLNAVSKKRNGYGYGYGGYGYYSETPSKKNRFFQNFFNSIS